MSISRHRFKDVLLALAVVHSHGESIGRLQLQKLIYIADILSILWESLAPQKGHETYKNGPYDPAIQNAIDVLTFRGAVKVIKSKIRSDQTVNARYQISNIGLRIIEKLKEEKPFAKKFELYQIIGKQVSLRGWHSLKELVYSEATYVMKKNEGWGIQLNPNSLFTNDSLRILLDFNTLTSNESSKLSKQNLVSIFFKILDNYRNMTISSEKTDEY